MISYARKEAFLAVIRDFLQICERAVRIHQSPSERLVAGVEYFLPTVSKEDDRHASL